MRVRRSYDASDVRVDRTRFRRSVREATPANGTIFSGVVRYVGDGDGLCVGPVGRSDRWIEIRLADFCAPELHEPGSPEATARLRRIALAMLICRAIRCSYDRLRRHVWCAVDRSAGFCERPEVPKVGKDAVVRKWFL